MTRRVMLGASLSWLAGVALAAMVVAHEMGELTDRTLEASARFSLELYRAATDVQTPTASGPIRVIRAGVPQSDAPWPPLTRDGKHDVPGWRVVRLSDPQSGVAVEVGQSDSWRRDELVESLGWLVVLLLPVLLAALLAVRGAVASGLRPATGLAQLLRNRSAQDLSPVDAGSLPIELAPIPQALNAYLEDIRRRIEAERQFATNAAHELRTPVAAASGQAQLIAAGLATDGAAARLTAALARMGHLIERLLQLSRAEAGPAGAGPADLVRVVRLVVADLGSPVLFDDAEMAALAVAVDPDALALILSNLLRNAVAHGTGSPRIRLAPGPMLTITNPVAAGASFRHGLFDKSPDSSGSGLGLAIVTRVAQAQGIAVDFAVAAGHARVTLRFPPAPQAAVAA